MTKDIDATFENGAFRPVDAASIPLDEGTVCACRWNDWLRFKMMMYLISPQAFTRDCRKRTSPT